MLRVDGNPAVTLTPQGPNHFLESAAAHDMAEQFRTGNTAVMRVHAYPDCEPLDLPVSLKGFAAVWTRFEAEHGR